MIHYTITFKKRRNTYEKKQFLNPLLVLLFPTFTIIFIPLFINHALNFTARTYNIQTFWFISLSWILIGFAMAMTAYRLTVSDKSDSFTKWIVVIWTVLLIVLLAGFHIGYSYSIYTTLHLYGTFFVELTTGFYLSLIAIIHFKK